MIGECGTTSVLAKLTFAQIAQISPGVPDGAG
jgi:hypothetical protein